MPSKLSKAEKLKIIKRALKGVNITRICKEAGISRTLLYRWIKKYNEKRKAKSEKILRPQDRLNMIERVGLGEDVLKVCRLYKVSRTVFYKWKERYDKAPDGGKLEALWDKKPKIDRYYNQAPDDVEDSVLAAVREYPELSTHKLVWVLPQVGGRPVLGNHGVQNVLTRHNLSTYEQRLAFSQAYKKPTFASRFFGAAQAVLAALSAQEVGRRKLFVRGSFVFVITLFTSTAFYGAWALFGLLAQSPSLAFSIGMIFSLIALGFGMFFFLYSLKYYSTIAMVLSYSRKLNDDKSLIHTPGLRPDLSKVTLDRKPFVSIHLATYNEKKVLDRLLTACSSQEYENYEVILVDDSTDEEVLGILKKWQSHPRVKIIHRDSREGYKGGALREALRASSPKTEFVVVFDADFIPYPDTIVQFLKYFKLSTGSLDDYSHNIAAVQGYQWHVLNKSENWITRGVRSEYAGSYVIERSGEEIYGGLKQIAGSVYMIRADLLKKFGWGTSITEDFQLTLRLYQAGYKVVFTPYIQAPAEAVSTIKRLIRQRMRWAEGHSFNIKRMLVPMLFGSSSSSLTLPEKFELLYLTPYYLQASFFIIGTFSWFLAEVVFKAQLPFWTATWGWSLVLTNLFALPLMNLVGLFLEEADEKDYLGLVAFIGLSYIVAPFQGYAAVKGFLEKEEGPWFRTPKTGKITDVFTPNKFYKFVFGVLGRHANQRRMENEKTYAGIQRLSDGESEREDEDNGQWTMDNGQRTGYRWQTKIKLQLLKQLFFLFKLLKIENLKLNENLKLKIENYEYSPALAVRSAFSSFRTIHPPKRLKSRLTGKIILVIFLGLTILLNNLAFLDKLGFDVIGLGGQGAPLAPDPALEQQINIIDQEYSTNNTQDRPTDNSLGIVRWTSGSYTPAPTVYFEAVIRNSNNYITTAALYNLTTGLPVASSSVSTSSKEYVRVRSSAITMTDATDYTARVKSSDSAGTAYILAARIIALQSDPTLVTATETQIEAGDSSSTTASTATALSTPKYFQFDAGAYSGTVNSYFEATLKADDLSTGPNSPNSANCADDGAVGSVTWVNDSNAAAQDDQTANLNLDGTTSEYEECLNFGFSTPDTATILGVLLEGDIWATNNNNGGVVDNAIRLSVNGTISGDSKARASSATWTNPSDTDTYISWGGSTDLWGNTLDGTSGANGVDNANFGTGISAAKASSAGALIGARIDHMRLTVYWRDSGRAELYNRTDGAVVTNSSISTANTYWTRVRGASALTTNWDTTNDDEYEVRITSGSIANGKVIITQSQAGGITGTELYHNYLNTNQTQNSASIGTFSTTSQAQLPAILESHTSLTSTIGSSTYVYVLGGTTGTVQSTVYKSTLNSTTGDLGTFATTSQAQLPTILDFHTSLTSTIGSSTYVYVLGGTTGNRQSTVYKSTLNSTTGDLGTFATTSQAQLPTILRNHTSLTSTIGSSTYLYVLGGNKVTVQSTVYKSTLSNDYDSFGYNNLYESGNWVGGTFKYYHEGTLQPTKAGVAGNSRLTPGQLGKTEILGYGGKGDAGTFATTSQAQLPGIRVNQSSFTQTIGPSTYLYVLGGVETTSMSTAYKATLNSTTGDAGTFATTDQAQLPAIRSRQTALTKVIGAITYLYVIGGTNSTAVQSTVYKAALNSSTGDINTFATTDQAQLLTIRDEHTAITSAIGPSSYIYVLGGSDDVGLNSSTVYKSTLNSTTGDLGAFATTDQAQLPVKRAEHTTDLLTIGSSTYVYVLGGTAGSSGLSTVYKGTINGTTGDLGTFDTTSQGQLPINLYRQTSLTQTIGNSTYLYVVGGADNLDARQSTVYKSTINGTTGDVGTFATTTQGQLPLVRTSLSSAIATIGGSSYIYALGGTDGAGQSTIYKSTLDSGQFTRVRSSEITDPLTGATAGNAGTFSTTSQGQLVQTLQYLNTLNAKLGSSAYVYVLGGNSGGTRVSTVYKAILNISSGDLGLFSTSAQAQLPVIRDRHASILTTVGSSTYIYTIGGQDATATYSTVYKSTLNSTTGDVGTFATGSQGQLITILREHSLNIASIGPSSYLYVAGGTTGSLQSTVYKSTINGTTGDLGTFATTDQGQLPLVRTFHSSLTSVVGPSTYLYVLGGCGTGDCSTGAISTVYKSTINGTTGDLGTFATTSQGQLPVANDRHVSLIATLGNSTYIYVTGGTNAATSTVYRSTLNGTTGDLGTFATASQAQLPQVLNTHAGFVSTLGPSTYIYALGGCNAAACGWVSTVYKSALVEDLTPANIGTFSSAQQGQLPQILSAHSGAQAVVSGVNYIYILGGANSGANVSTVYKANIDASGRLSTFATTSQAQLPAIAANNASVAFRNPLNANYIYEIGGFNSTSLYSTVYRSQTNGSGNLGAFSTTGQGQLPQGLRNHQAITVTNGANYLYVLGGCSTAACAAGDTVSTVYKSTITVPADAGTFATTSQGQLLLTLESTALITLTIASSTYLYEIGGWDGSGAISTVYKSTLNSTTGDAGTFATTTQGQLPIIQAAANSVSSNINGSTYLYVIGGGAGGSIVRSTVYKSTLNGTTGDVGTFDTTSQAQLPANRTAFVSTTSSIGSSSYIYIIGGCISQTNCSGTIASTVYKSTLNGTTGDVGTFDTTSQAQLPQTLGRTATTFTSVIGPSAYIYVLGGCNASTCGEVSTVYKSTLNGTTGDVGTFDTTSQAQLPQILTQHTSVVTTGSSSYLYVMGGCIAGNCTTQISTVYKSTLNGTTGDVGTFDTTSQAQLPAAIRLLQSASSTIGPSTYLYVLGGCGTGDCATLARSTVYKSTLDTDADVGAFATTTQGQIPQSLKSMALGTVTISGTSYIYSIGGSSSTSHAPTSTVYRSTVDSSGDLGAFATTSQSQLPVALQLMGGVVTKIGETYYIYVAGGCTDSALNCTLNNTRYTVYRSTIDSSANAGAFSFVNGTGIPQLAEGSLLAASLGATTYLYSIGGTNGTTKQSAVYMARVSNSSFDTQLNNATVASSWTVVNITSLQVPENLLGLLPLGLLLPKLIQKFRKWRRNS